MPWGFAAAAAVGAVGSVVAGGEQASGEEQAANTQQQMFNTITGNEQPYMSSGNTAETTLNQLLGYSPATGKGGTAAGTNLAGGYLTQTFNPTMAQLEATPGYQFQLSQGDQAIQNSAAASTGAVSGAALKGLSSFNQGLASTTYQNQFNNFQTQQNNIFNRLSTIASLGQNAASNVGNNGAQLGTGIAQAQAAAAGSTAGGIVGATNSASQGALLSTLMGGQGGSSSGLPASATTSSYDASQAGANYDGSGG